MICGNCNSKIANGHEFCYRCGYNIRSGENAGDNSTGYLNVFRIDGRFAYIFMVKGKQVILMADSMEELESKAKYELFPWEELD